MIRYTHLRRTSGLVIGCLVLCSLAHCGDGTVTIHKPYAALKENPTLCVASFTGPASVRGLLLKTLRRSDWFEVVDNARGADHVVQVEYASGPPPSLTVRSMANSSLRIGFRQTASSAEPSRLVYLTVDQLIGTVFPGIPGLCASRIAFVVGGSGSKEIWTCNFDGTGASQLTRNRSISTEPSWGTKGATIVYTLYANNATAVVEVDVRGKRQRRISRFAGLNAGADLSPDGRWAALCLSRERRVDLYLLDMANTNRLLALTANRAAESSPCWSPNGRELCYVSDMRRPPQLYLIQAAGGAKPRRLGIRGEAVAPDWSSVSNMLCFAKREGPNYALAVLNMAEPSKGTKLVTRMAGDWESPSWAPDGRHVVCSRTYQGQSQLWMVDTWRHRAVAITRPADHSLPSWSACH